MIRTKQLSNGVRVIVKQMEGLLSVSMGVLVGTGAAFEQDDEDGISHFIEHMLFKGTPTRTAFELSDAFDALGAQVNAFTGKDMTCFYSKSTSDHAAEAFALLSDLFLNACFPEEEMEREKGVVLEEINMDEDSPEDLCLDLLSRAAFGNCGYGRNILGPAENVKKFSREDLFAYRRKRYCPENIVVSFAGSIPAEEAMALAERYFGGMAPAPSDGRKKEVRQGKGNLFRKKPIEQAHFALGFPTVAREDALRPAVQVMNTILGGGMSSRLFKKVREELGLAYSVYSYTSHYAETGMLTVYAGVNPDKAEDASAGNRQSRAPSSRRRTPPRRCCSMAENCSTTTSSTTSSAAWRRSPPSRGRTLRRRSPKTLTSPAPPSPASATSNRDLCCERARRGI